MSSLQMVPKSVHFRNFVEVAEIPLCSEFSADQRRCMWYNTTEIMIMKKQRKRIERIADLGFKQDDERCCTHGLYTREQCRQRYSQMKESLMVVLIEQELQWEEDSHCSETIAQVYAESIDDMRLNAQERASSLAEEIRTGFLKVSCSPEVTSSTSGSKKPRVGALDVEFRRWDMSGEQEKCIFQPQQRRFSLPSTRSGLITAPVA
jgi:hypothetical protein